MSFMTGSFYPLQPENLFIQQHCFFGRMGLLNSREYTVPGQVPQAANFLA